MIASCPTFCKSPKLLTILAVVGLIFGGATLYSGGNVLFGGDAARAAAGDYVPFVVWFNFIAGFAYIAAAAGLLLDARWAAYLARGIVLATVLTFLAFGLYAWSGYAVEPRTAAALGLRIGVWLAIACVARQVLVKRD